MAGYDDKPLLQKLLTWGAVALLAIAALKLVFWLFGAVVGIAAFLLFTVLPLALAGWILYQLVRVIRGERGRDHA